MKVARTKDGTEFIDSSDSEDETVDRMTKFMDRLHEAQTKERGLGEKGDRNNADSS